MGQDLKYLITTEKIKVPIYLVHFKEENSIIFPMLIEDSVYEEISDYSKESNDSVSDFFNAILYGGYDLKYPTERLFKFVKYNNLKTLALIPYREFGDLPLDIGIPICFINDKIIDLSQENLTENEIHEKIGAKISFWDIIRNESKYWCYENLEITYLENLNKRT